uniref:Uncharacterized protein n=1 Tax=Anguilla anguilla TaxID=7936 RepID=A0A0E9V569_ANGAN
MYNLQSLLVCSGFKSRLYRSLLHQELEL